MEQYFLDMLNKKLAFLALYTYSMAMPWSTVARRAKNSSFVYLYSIAETLIA